MKFGPADRSLIYEAAEARKWISVVGDLKRQGQRLTLQNARDLTIIIPEDVEPDMLTIDGDV